MPRPSFRAAVAAAVFVSIASTTGLVAQQGVRTQRVQFKPGASSATIQGSIRGYETIDYLLSARQGQSMNVSMATKHGSTYFNILAPGETEVAFFIGSTSGNQYEGALPATGDYRVRVYMMRNAARRNETASYRLEIAITGGGAPHAGGAAPGDAKVPGTDFHATGPLRCSMRGEQLANQCNFGVKREGNGSGLVEVTKPDGRKRIIFFERGRATGYDASQADNAPFSASRQGDVTIVKIGAERYEIVDAVIYGG